MLKKLSVLGIILATIGFCEGKTPVKKVVNEKEINFFVEKMKLSHNLAELKIVISEASNGIVLIHTINNQAKNNGLIYNSSILPRKNERHYYHGVTNGVILSKDGLVCTTYESVKNAKQIIVSINSESKFENFDDEEQKNFVFSENDYKAYDIQYVPQLNLAFFKIKPKGKENFKYIKLGSDSVLINQEKKSDENSLKNCSTFVIGKARGNSFVNVVNPAVKGMNFEIFASLISQLKYSKVEGKSILEVSSITSSPAILPENSGGGIIDETGELLGLAVYDSFHKGVQISYGIPVSIIKQALGVVYPSFFKKSRVYKFGIFVEEDKSKKGVKVSSIIDNFGAQNAGIAPGDFIVSINGESVSNKQNFEQIENSLFGAQKAVVKILRGRQTMEYEVSLVDSTNS